MRHRDVYLVFSETFQTFAFVSGKNFSEVKKRLQEETEVPTAWTELKTFITVIPAALLDLLGALDTSSIDSERHFIKPKFKREK